MKRGIHRIEKVDPFLIEFFGKEGTRATLLQKICIYAKNAPKMNNKRAFRINQYTELHKIFSILLSKYDIKRYFIFDENLNLGIKYTSLMSIVKYIFDSPENKYLRRKMFLLLYKHLPEHNVFGNLDLVRNIVLFI